MAVEKKDVFLNLHDKTLLVISSSKMTPKNPLLSGEFNIVLFDEAGTELRQEEPQRMSLLNFCTKFDMHHIQDCSKTQLLKKLYNKAVKKGLRLMYLKNGTKDIFEASADFSDPESVVGVIYCEREDTPNNDFSRITKFLKRYVAWKRHENFNLVYYDLNGNLQYREVKSMGKDYNANSLGQDLGSSWEKIGSYSSVKDAIKKAGKTTIAYFLLRHDILRVSQIVDLADSMRNAYFWSGLGNASDRARYDSEHSDCYSWQEGGHDYYAVFETSSSCKNVYTSSCYKKDGVKTNLKAIRNSLKRMEEELSHFDIKE